MAKSWTFPYFLFLLSVLSATSNSAQTACYNPSGTDRNDQLDVTPGSTAYVPCNQVNPFSMCCRYGGDDCRPDGLCQGYAADGSKPIWRESCTDKTWTSPHCLKLCIRGETANGFDYNDGDITVHECPDGGFCCGEHNSTCCGTPEAQYIVNGQVTNVKPSSTSTTSSSSISSSTSPSTSSPISGQVNSLPQPVPSGGTNVGAIAGGAVGGVVALALIGAAIWFLRGRRKHKESSEQQQQSPHQPQDGYFSPSKSPAPPQYHVHPGLHEAYGGPDGLVSSQLDSQEKYEIGYQNKDRMGTQELP